MNSPQSDVSPPVPGLPAPEVSPSFRPIRLGRLGLAGLVVLVLATLAGVIRGGGSRCVRRKRKLFSLVIVCPRGKTGAFVPRIGV